MTYNAEVQFKFDATFTPTYGSSSWSDDDFVPEEHYLITAPAADLNAKQYFKLFEKFLLCVGMCPKSIRSGAMSLVFNDWTLEEEQRKVCDEYELTMDEDLDAKFREWVKRDEDIARLRKGTDTVADNVEAMYWKNKYIEELAKQGKLETHSPESHQYTEDEMDAMCDAAEEKEKCREYNLREAEYYDKRAQLDMKTQ